MMLQSPLRRDQKGIGAVEFALVAPAFIAMIVGVSQMGKLFFANADMKNAAAAGARAASVWPIPDDATILAAVNGRLAASNGNARATPSVVHGTDGNGNAYVEIRMSYTVPLEFIFFEMAPITLTDSRRVFTQVTNANQTSFTTTTGSTGGTTSSTGGTTSSTGGTTSSTGGTTSSTGGTTSSTTTGGTTSSTTTGGTTSATSAGGTTSSTSASSTGGTSATSASSTSSSSTSSSSTSASSTTSASSSSSNGSNGNGSSGNNGSSGHSHGNCNKKC